MKKRSNPKIEAMKERSLIVENERKNLHTPKFYINEQEEEIKQPAGDPYEYKKDESGYYFKKRDEEKWKKTNNSAVKSVFGDGEQKSVTKSSGESKSSVKVPFKNTEEGNAFRQWVNNTHPDYAKEIDLDKEGSYNNSYIAKAWNKYGKDYKSAGGQSLKNVTDNVKFSKYANPKFKIDPNELSTTDTSNLSCKPIKGNTKCATFVNNYSEAIKTVGDAWKTHDIDATGRRIFSIYESIPSDVINEYIDIYKGIVNKEDVVSRIKQLQSKLLQSKKLDVNVKIDDIVGIYYEPSNYHVDAFYEAGKPYFVDGDPNKVGNTLKDGRGFSFNTHVGIVGATKDGVPLVFHNVGGQIKSDPVDNLKITWVKRKGGNWLTDIFS